MVVELEVPLVVELEQCGTVRVFLLQVQVVVFGLSSGVTALFAHVHLGSPLFVGVAVLDAVHLEHVRLQRAALSERLATVRANVRSHTCVRSCMSFQVEGVVESFGTEDAQVSLDVTVAFQMAVEQPLETEHLGADATHELGRIVAIDSCQVLQVCPGHTVVLVHDRVLNTVTTVDEL